MLPSQLGRRGEVLFGYHQYMHWGLGIDVPECQHALSLVNYVGVYLVRRDLAEQTVLSHRPPSLVMVPVAEVIVRIERPWMPSARTRSPMTSWMLPRRPSPSNHTRT